MGSEEDSEDDQAGETKASVAAGTMEAQVLEAEIMAVQVECKAVAALEAVDGRDERQHL